MLFREKHLSYIFNLDNHLLNPKPANNGNQKPNPGKMYAFKSIHIIVAIAISALIGCSDIANPKLENSKNQLNPILSSAQ